MGQREHKKICSIVIFTSRSMSRLTKVHTATSAWCWVGRQWQNIVIIFRRWRLHLCCCDDSCCLFCCWANSCRGPILVSAEHCPLYDPCRSIWNSRSVGRCWWWCTKFLKWQLHPWGRTNIKWANSPSWTDKHSPRVDLFWVAGCVYKNFIGQICEDWRRVIPTFFNPKGTAKADLLLRKTFSVCTEQNV